MSSVQKKCFSSQVKRTSGVFLSVLKGMFMKKKNPDSLIYSPSCISKLMYDLFLFGGQWGTKEDLFCPYHGLIGSNTVLDPSEFYYIYNFLIVFISQVWNHMRLSI